MKSKENTITYEVAKKIIEICEEEEHPRQKTLIIWSTIQRRRNMRNILMNKQNKRTIKDDLEVDQEWEDFDQGEEEEEEIDDHDDDNDDNIQEEEEEETIRTTLHEETEHKSMTKVKHTHLDSNPQPLF